MKKDDYLDKEKALAETQRKTSKVKWGCMCPKCIDKAINSHLLQRHGILNHVMVDNHLYEITREDAFKWHENYPVRIKKVGLNNAISYPLFCYKHDSEIFLPIEGGAINFDDYKSQLLFSYRAVCAEIRKKEINQLEVQGNSDIIDEMSIVGAALIEGGDMGIKDLNYYKYLLEEELKTCKRKFTFFHYSYPVLDIYSSATMSYEIFDSNSERQVDAALKKKVWDAVFIHIIPQSETTEIIVGYHHNHSSRDLEEYVHSWKDLGNEELGYKLTDLFVAHVEDWGMSPRLFEKISEERFQKFFELQAEYSASVFEQKTNVGYNLFEGLS